MDDLRMNVSLTATEVLEIKFRLWAGERQADVAARYRVSQTTVSRILHGKQWRDVPWPNGETGPLPAQRVRELRLLRTSTGAGMDHVEVPQPRRKRPSLREPWPPEERPKKGEEKKEQQTTPETEQEPISDLEEAVRRYREDKRKRAEAVEELGEKAEAEMEEELLKSVISTSGEKRVVEHPEPKPTDFDMLPWPEVVKGSSKRNRMVLAAQHHEPLRQAVQIVFKVLPKSEWNTQKAEELVKETSEMLGHKINIDFGLGSGKREKKDE